MNKVELIGRLTKDPELKFTANQTKYCQFSLAVERRFKDKEGQRVTDFINCIAWRNTAEFITKYFKKGARIGASGSIQTRSYDDENGIKRFVTEVVIDEAEFVESSSQQTAEPSETGPEQPAEDQQEHLPFQL